jgi:UDP-N-acetyl-D-glucosamine dehydrogenase
VVFSPEREDPGNETVARMDIPKVVGGCSPDAVVLATLMYGTIFRHLVPVSSPSVAEMTKLLENIYRCVNIALVNEIKQLCMKMGIDIHEVIDAAKTKPFGFQAFYPGPGLGGHCIPIDPFYLSWKTKQAGIEARFIELAGYINGQMPHFVVDKIQNALNDAGKPVKGSHIHILGVAYKKDIEDLRESPALDIMLLLKRRGARLTYSDPYVPHLQLDGDELQAQPEALAGEADCAVIITDHSSFDYPRIAAQARLIVDTRNALKDVNSAHIVRL